MKVIEIQIQMDSVFEGFETNTISAGMIKNAPGGAAGRDRYVEAEARASL